MRVPATLAIVVALAIPTAVLAQPSTRPTATDDPDAPALIVGTNRLGRGTLLRIPLDGVNEPQMLAEIEDAAIPGWSSQWSIAPDGRTALHLPDHGNPAAAAFIDLQTGIRRDLPAELHLTASDTPPVWSVDGGRALLFARGYRVLDARTGRSVRLRNRGWDVRGFDPRGRVILSQTAEGPGDLDTW